jgi:hypothetical protein
MYNYLPQSIICKVKLWRVEAMTMALQRRDPSPSRPFPNGNLESNGQSKGRGHKANDDQLVERIRRFSSLSQDDFMKMKNAEQQDDFFTLRNAQDITNPDTKGDTHSLLSIKIVPNSFRRILGVKEICSKQGTFLHRTIDLPHKPGDSLGFLIRQGDGWSRTDGIFISRLVLGTDVDNFELLRVGDEIIRVNKVDVRGMNVEDVSALMQMAKRLIITVKVLTPLSKKKLFALSNGGVRTRPGTASPNPRQSKESQERLGLSTPSEQYRNIPRMYSHQTNYKIASLPIGKSSNNNKGSQSPNLSRPRSVGRPPTPGKRALSPIHETYDSQGEPSGILATGRRKSLGGSNSVSWSDQVSTNNTSKTNIARTAKSGKAGR